MVKHWTPERQQQLRKLYTLLGNMESINRTTNAITYITEGSNIAKELLYPENYEKDIPSFWSFLIQELNKE